MDYPKLPDGMMGFTTEQIAEIMRDDAGVVITIPPDRISLARKPATGFIRCGDVAKVVSEQTFSEAEILEIYGEKRGRLLLDNANKLPETEQS